MRNLAEKAHHLTPELLLLEQRKLQSRVPLIIVHIKPAFYDEVIGDLEELHLSGLEISCPEKVYEF